MSWLVLDRRRLTRPKNSYLSHFFPCYKTLKYAKCQYFSASLAICSMMLDIAIKSEYIDNKYIFQHLKYILNSQQRGLLSLATSASRQRATPFSENIVSLAFFKNSFPEVHLVFAPLVSRVLRDSTPGYIGPSVGQLAVWLSSRFVHWLVGWSPFWL